jgi:hypothetical protein
MKNSKYVVLKDIPLNKEGTKTIPKGSEISVTHDCVYFNGGLLPPDYQADFKTLITKEERSGWKYLHPDNPIVGNSIVKGA